MAIVQAKAQTMSKPTVEASKINLDQLDLMFIVNKMSSELYELPRWPKLLAQEALQLYKNFLWLHVKHPTEKLVPTRDIDECWHLHILSTKRYKKDCELLFGDFFHHSPSDPSNPDELNELLPLFSKTQALYEKEFGKPLMVFDRTLSCTPIT